MKKEFKLNEEAALNNNVDSTTLQMNSKIKSQHKKAKMDDKRIL
ncbi:hypothetical protein [Bacillus sp. HMF5848]|nr:hypothetical protein [Bacillus sp. HMF5848]